jgi:hypothetical protein
LPIAKHAVDAPDVMSESSSSGGEVITQSFFCFFEQIAFVY